jgi:Molecular chaperone (small heat shock protein)
MANLQVYRPFRDLWSLPDELGRLFWGLNRFEPEVNSESPLSWTPAVDVAEDEEAMHIRADLPGLKREQVKINVRDGVLTLSGEKKFEEEKKTDNYYRLERSYGSFARSFTLPNTVDVEKIRASMKDGVLELTVPKKPEAKAREIKVDIS